MVVWAEHGPDYNYMVRSSYRPVGGQFGALGDVSVRQRLPRTCDPQVALGPNGGAVAVWIQDATGSGVATRVIMGAVGHAGAWEAPTQLSAPASPEVGVGSHQVTIGAAGDAVAAWRESSVRSPFPAVIKASIRPSGGAFGAAGACQVE
jgi:hypothetical protein